MSLTPENSFVVFSSTFYREASIRYYGLLSPANRHRLVIGQNILSDDSPLEPVAGVEDKDESTPDYTNMTCRFCGKGIMIIIKALPAIKHTTYPEGYHDEFAIQFIRATPLFRVLRKKSVLPLRRSASSRHKQRHFQHIFSHGIKPIFLHLDKKQHPPLFYLLSYQEYRYGHPAHLYGPTLKLPIQGLSEGGLSPTGVLTVAVRCKNS